MKHLVTILMLLCCLAQVQAQKITRSYRNVAMPEVLRDLSQLSPDYTVSFLYNELEDFRVTTTIRHQSLPDAIQQVVGFYPIRVVKRGERELYVECTHKTDRHLTGTIVDEQGLPVAYANVAVMNAADSALLSGGVSNESGYFAIPIEQTAVLARISFVGYKTVWRQSSREHLGTIRLQPESYTINGVTVEGERPKVKLDGNTLVMNVEGTVMERLGTAEDVLSRVPMISKKGDSFEILGKGVPLIYVNNRKLSDLQELRNIQSDFIRSVEVVQNPGARYDATVQAVIVIRTRRAAGEGLGVELTSWSRKSHGYQNNERLNLTYRMGHLELFANLFGAYNKRWETGEFEQTVFADTLWVITNKQRDKVYNPFLEGRFGFNYQFNDNNSFGGFYQNTYDYVKTWSDYDDDLQANGDIYDHLTNHSLKRAKGMPLHQVNLYFVGKMGKADIDFNADYSFRHQHNLTTQQELSEEYDDRDVSIDNLTRSRMMAEKLIVSHPLWKGQIEVGEEFTYTQWTNDFKNREGYIRGTAAATRPPATAGRSALRARGVGILRQRRAAQ